MLTLDKLDKIIYEGMTEDSGEQFNDIAHHVRNAARAVYAAMTEQNEALEAVMSLSVKAAILAGCHRRCRVSAHLYRYTHSACGTQGDEMISPALSFGTASRSSSPASTLAFR